MKKRKREEFIENEKRKKKKKRKIVEIKEVVEIKEIVEIKIPDVLIVNLENIENIGLNEKYLDSFFKDDELIIFTLIDNKLNIYSKFRKIDIPWITETISKKQLTLKDVPSICKFTKPFQIVYQYKSSINILNLDNNTTNTFSYKNFIIEDFIFYLNHLYISIDFEFKIFEIRDNKLEIRISIKPFKSLLDNFLNLETILFNTQNRISQIKIFGDKIFIGGEKTFKIYNIDTKQFSLTYEFESDNDNFDIDFNFLKLRFLTSSSNKKLLYLCNNDYIFSFNLKKDYKEILKCKNVKHGYYSNNFLFFTTNEKFFIYDLIEKKYVLEYNSIKNIKDIKEKFKNIYLIK
jgi:hypothetical protein